ncbi:MAG: OB-fold nucleic acid binding domain-containing protein, partial [Ruthenibacterium sp.]
TGEEARGYDGKGVCIVCTIVHTKTITTKAGGLMAFITVEDLTGMMEVLAFPKTLLTCSEAVHDNAVVVVRGKISVKEEESPKLLADTISDINASEPEKLKQDTEHTKSGLWLRVPSRSGEVFAQVQNLLSIFEGTTPVYLYVEDEHKKMLTPKSMWCTRNKLLFSEMERILGTENVKVQ